MTHGEIEVDYRVRSTPAEIEGRAEALLLEQTVELPRTCLTSAFVREQIVGRLAACRPDGEGAYVVTLAQPERTAGSDPAQLLNVLFGNSSLQPEIELVDVRLPADLAARLGGPRFGTEGLRALTGVRDRAFTATALKPMGLSASELGRLCHAFALGGIDVVKDDHGLADHAFCGFEERVRACLAATASAAETTGRRTLYVPNLIGGPAEVRRQAALARRLGVGAVMVSPMLVGLPFLAELVRDLGMPVLAHPAFAGAQRMSPLALLGRLFPLYGADAVIYPNAGGRFSYSQETCDALVGALRSPGAAIRPVLPVPAGGMKTENVPAVLKRLGPDVMLLVGGSLLSPSAVPLVERCRQFAGAVQHFRHSQ